MQFIHQPRRYAAIVAVGPLSWFVALIFASAAAVDTALTGAIGILWIVLNFASVPLVILGVWFDAPVVKEHTGVTMHKYWYIFVALTFAPLLGTVYLFNRWRYFERA